jgi:Leucine-rich repeat (LRR) protein
MSIEHLPSDCLDLISGHLTAAEKRSLASCSASLRQQSKRWYAQAMARDNNDPSDGTQPLTVHAHVGTVSAGTLARWLKSNGVVANIVIHGAHGGEGLVEFLAGLEHVASTHIRHMHMADGTPVVFPPHMAHSFCVVSMRLEGDAAGSTTLPPTLKALDIPAAALEHLDHMALRGILDLTLSVHDHTRATVARHIGALAQLRRLELVDHTCSADPHRPLPLPLSTLTNLTRLHIGRAYNADFRVLRTLTQLRHLSMAPCFLSVHEERRGRSAVRRLTGLTTLETTFSRDKSWRRMDTLTNLQTLRILAPNGNTNHGAHLGRSLAAFTALTALTMDVPLADDADAAFAVVPATLDHVRFGIDVPVPAAVSALTALTRLDTRTEVPPGALRALPNLRHLSTVYNPDMHADLQSATMALTKLELHGMASRHLGAAAEVAAGMPTLRALEFPAMRYCRATTPMRFAALTHLTSLDLGGWLAAPVLETLTNLQRLGMHECQDREMQVVAALPKLRHLNLVEENPLRFEEWHPLLGRGIMVTFDTTVHDTHDNYDDDKCSRPSKRPRFA